MTGKIPKAYKEELFEKINRGESSSSQIAESEENVKNQKVGIGRYVNFTFFLVNITAFAIILFILSRTPATMIPLGELFEGRRISGLLLFVMIFASFILINVIASFRNFLLIYRVTKRNRFYLAYSTHAIGKYHDFITPLATGGQAFQIVHMHKNGVRASTASGLPMTEFVFNKLTFVLACVFLLSFATFVFKTEDFITGFVSVWAYIGLGIQFLLMLGVFILSNFKKLGAGATISILKILAKIKIIKDYKLTYLRVLRFVNGYQKAMRSFISNFPIFFLGFLGSVLILLLRLSIPFAMHTLFFGMTEFTFQNWLILSSQLLICELAFGLWLLPGNVIVADLVFVAMFKDIFTGGTLFWAVLIWRLFTYYAYLVQGQVIKIVESVRERTKEKKIKAKTVSPSGDELHTEEDITEKQEI